jgi:carbonic anhydrase
MLFRYHNLEEPITQEFSKPAMLIGTCMDYRVALRLPRRFAYILRTAGDNLTSHEFDIAVAIGLGAISAMALIGHTDCAMSRVTQQRDAFVSGMVQRAGWQSHEAAQYFQRYASSAHIGDPTDYTMRETTRLRRRFPGILVAPLLYQVEDNQLVQIAE